MVFQIAQNDDPFAKFEAESAKLGLLPTENSNDIALQQQSNEPDPFAAFEAESAKLGLTPNQPNQTAPQEEGEGTQANPQEETINLFGSPYLWVSKAKKRAENIDRTVDVLGKVATNPNALTAASKLSGNAAKAYASGLAGGAVDTMASLYNLPASLENFSRQKAHEGIHGAKATKESKEIQGVEKGIEPLKQDGFGRDAQRLEKFFKENDMSVLKERLPLIPSVTHFLSDLLDVKETGKASDGKDYPIPFVKPARLIGEIQSGGLLKKGIEKGIEKGILHSNEAMNALQSFLKVTSSTDPKVLASAGVMGMMEDVAKWHGAGDGTALGVGIVSSLVTDYASRKGISTLKAFNELKGKPDEKLFRIFKNYLADSIKLEDSTIDIIKKYGGNLNLALATDDGFIKKFINIIRGFGDANAIFKKGAKTHGDEIQNAFDSVLRKRLDETLSEVSQGVKPQELGLDHTVQYMNTPIRGDNVFSSAGSSETTAFGGSLKTSVEANKVSKQKQIIADHKEASQNADNFIKNVKEEQKEHEKIIRSAKETNVQEEIQSSVDSLYSHLGDTSNPQFASEYAVDAFKIEKDARKLKKNELYNKIDYKGVQGKPENALEFLEERARSLASTLNRSPDESAVLKRIHQILEELGVKVSKKELEKFKEQIKTSGGSEIELPPELLMDLIKRHKGAGELKEIPAKRLADSIRSVHGIAYKNNQELQGVKSLYGGLKGAYEEDLSSMLKAAGNEKALKDRAVANKHYAEEIAGKNYSTVGKGIVKGDLPKSPLSYMNSVDGIRLVQKTLGNSEQSKEAFRMLKEAKIKELFLDKIRNPDGTINVSKFQAFFNRKDMTQEALQELMGKERFFHFKQIAMDTEKYHQGIMEQQLKRVSEDAAIRLKAAENLKAGISSREKEALKAVKGTTTLEEVGRTRLDIIKKLDNPDKLGKEAKKSLEELLETTEKDIKAHFGEDKDEFRNYMLAEQEKVLEQRQDAYRDFFGKGITNPTTDTVNWGALPRIMNDKTKRAYLENIAGKENIAKLDELSEWSSTIRENMEKLNPSGTAAESAGINLTKQIIKSIVGGGAAFAAWMFKSGTIGATAVGAGTTLSVGKYAVKGFQKFSELSAKVLSDPKFYDLALAIKKNPSPTKIERFKGYLKERTGLGVQEFRELYVSSLEDALATTQAIDE